MAEAEHYLLESQGIFRELTESSVSKNFSEEEPEQRAKMLQLVLQYRLDTQDVLSKLRLIEHSLLQLLGIEKQSPNSVNYNNMAYFLGKEDLHQALSALNLIVDLLLRVAHKQQKNQKTFASHKANLYHHDKFEKTCHKMEKSIQKLKSFTAILDETSRQMDLFFRLEVIGPVLNHVAALQGPISRFYQLVLSGLKDSFLFYKKINHDYPLGNQLDNLMHDAKCVLTNLAINTQPNRLFTHVNDEYSEDLLDLRAEKRRLGYYVRN